MLHNDKYAIITKYRFLHPIIVTGTSAVIIHSSKIAQFLNTVNIKIHGFIVCLCEQYCLGDDMLTVFIDRKIEIKANV